MIPALEALAEAGLLWPLILVAGSVLAGTGEALCIFFRWQLYFLAGAPLAAEPMPVLTVPAAQGETATVRWAADEEVALFWASQGGLPGLHGAVRLVHDRGRIRLLVVWAPPWTLFVGLVLLASWSANLGRGLALVPASAVAAVAVFILYRQAAIRAARELRWAWVRGEDDEEP
jgi:hypothetical protein